MQKNSSKFQEMIFDSPMCDEVASPNSRRALKAKRGQKGHNVLETEITSPKWMDQYKSVVFISISNQTN